MDPREANEVIQAEYKRIRKLRVRNVVLIVLVVVLAAIPMFFYFRMATQAHLGAGFLYELQAGRTYSPTRFLLDLGVGAGRLFA